MTTTTLNATKANTLTRSITIAVVIGLTYFGLCMANPYLASGSIATWGFFEGNFRIAKALNAFRIVSLPANIGCGLGALAFNGYQGKLALPQYWIQTALFVAIYYAGYTVLKRTGKSLLSLTAVFLSATVLVNLIGSLNVAAIGLFITGFSDITWSVVLMDTFMDSMTAITLGYPLLLAYWKFRR
jgi:hypothetical protein